MEAQDTTAVRLTSLSHGGGCGCKIAPAALEQIMARNLKGLVPEALLVGAETSDDAAVYRIGPSQAIVATTDFFMPIVDDPFDFGAIAATNALSDVYAMGAQPLFALALVGMPIGRLPLETVKLVLEGGEAACARAGIPVAGGHSIDSLEPIYGLAAIGLVDPARLKRNSTARPGDRLVLGKPLGIGIYGAALKKEQLGEARYHTMVDWATKLNTPGMRLGQLEGVHALTDVTGFGVLGHLLEMCRGSRVGAILRWDDLPLLPDVGELVAHGHQTGGSARNWSSYGANVDLRGLGELEQIVLTDPQTSGGLLVSCAQDAVEQVLEAFRADGFGEAALVGEILEGPAAVTVR